MARAGGKNSKVSDEAMSNIRSVVREGLDVLDHNSDLFVGRELKGTWAERGMSFFRLTVEPENVSAGFMLFCRSEQRQAFKVVMCDSEANVLHTESCRKNCSEVAMHFTHFDTYAVPALRNTDVTTGTAIPGTSLLPESSKTASLFSVPADDCDTALGVFTALDGVKPSKRSIVAGKYLVCVLSAAPQQSSGPVRGGFTIAAFVARGARDPSAQAMAQVDAEVFRQKEAMQEVKTGYLKAKAEYLVWLQRAAEEEVHVAALLEKKDRAYFNHTDASLKASALPVRAHVVYNQQGVATGSNTATGAWGVLSRQLTLGKSAIEAMMRSPGSAKSSAASTPQQQQQAQSGKPPRPFSTSVLSSPSSAQAASTAASSSAFSTPVKSAPSSALNTPASTGGKGKILARYIYQDEDEGEGASSSAEPLGAFTAAPSPVAAQQKSAPVEEKLAVEAALPAIAEPEPMSAAHERLAAIAENPAEGSAETPQAHGTESNPEAAPPAAALQAESSPSVATSLVFDLAEEPADVPAREDAVVAAAVAAADCDQENLSVSVAEDYQSAAPLEMDAGAELSPTRSPKRVHWPEDSPVAGSADAPVSPSRSSQPTESAETEQDKAPMSSLERIFGRSPSETETVAQTEQPTEAVQEVVTEATPSEVVAVEEKAEDASATTAVQEVEDPTSAPAQPEPEMYEEAVSPIPVKQEAEVAVPEPDQEVAEEAVSVAPAEQEVEAEVAPVVVSEPEQEVAEEALSAAPAEQEVEAEAEAEAEAEVASVVVSEPEPEVLEEAVSIAPAEQHVEAEADVTPIVVPQSDQRFGVAAAEPAEVTAASAVTTVASTAPEEAETDSGVVESAAPVEEAPPAAALALAPPAPAVAAALDTSKSPKSPAKKKRKSKNGKKKGATAASAVDEATTEDGAEDEEVAVEGTEGAPAPAEPEVVAVPQETPLVAVAEEVKLAEPAAVVLEAVSEASSAVQPAASAVEMIEVEERDEDATGPDGTSALDDTLNTTADFEDALDGISTPPEATPPPLGPVATAWSAHPDAQDQTPVPMVWDLPPSVVAPASPAPEPVPVPMPAPAPAAVETATTTSPASNDKTVTAEKPIAPTLPAAAVAAASAPVKKEASPVIAAKAPATTPAAHKNGDSGKAKPSMQEAAATIAKSAAALDAFTASTKPATPVAASTPTPVPAAANGARGATSVPNTQKTTPLVPVSAGFTPTRSPAGPAPTAASKGGDSWGFPAATNTWDFAPSKTASSSEAPKATPAPSVWGQPTPNLAPARANSGTFAPTPAAQGAGFGSAQPQARPVSMNGYNGSNAPQQQQQQYGWQAQGQGQALYGGSAPRPGNGMGIASTGMGSAAHPTAAPVANTVKANKKYLEMNDPFAGL